MKRYTRTQIQESIKYWQKQLKAGNYKRMNESIISGNKIVVFMFNDVNGDYYNLFISASSMKDAILKLSNMLEKNNVITKTINAVAIIDSNFTSSFDIDEINQVVLAQDYHADKYGNSREAGEMASSGLRGANRQFFDTEYLFESADVDILISGNFDFSKFVAAQSNPRGVIWDDADPWDIKFDQPKGWN